MDNKELDKSRAEFEAWAEGYFMCFVLHRAGEGYTSTMTQAAWEAWQAARAGTATPAAPTAYLRRMRMANGNWSDWAVSTVHAYDKSIASPYSGIEVKPVFDAAPALAAPAAAQKEGASEQDAKDAARYRWLRHADLDALAVGNWGTGQVYEGVKFDEAIDAAMSAAQTQPKDTTDTPTEKN